MATVRINQEIKNHVSSRIVKMYEARIIAKQEELQHLDIGMQVLMSRVDPTEYAAAVKLNNGANGHKWVQETTTMAVRVRYKDGDVERLRSFTIKFAPPVPIPAHLGPYVGSSENKILPHMACYEPCVKIYRELDALIGERDKLHNSIAALLNTCGTLRQVLEHWPTALDFMPDNVRARHGTKDDAKRTAVAIATPDDEAKILLMKARLLSGT